MNLIINFWRKKKSKRSHFCSFENGVYVHVKVSMSRFDQLTFGMLCLIYICYMLNSIQ